MKKRKEIELCKTEKVHEREVKKALKTIPPERNVKKTAEIFRGLGDVSRAKILFLLRGSELCVCDISRALKMTQSAVSHQLRVLRNLDLLDYRKDGKSVFYSLKDSHIENLLSQALSHTEEKQ